VDEADEDEQDEYDNGVSGSDFEDQELKDYAEQDFADQEFRDSEEQDLAEEPPTALDHQQSPSRPKSGWSITYFKRSLGVLAAQMKDKLNDLSRLLHVVEVYSQNLLEQPSEPK
jgi:hypothetical protein